ncbi:hypothetical protein AWM75_05775 [Aerococcus urinaehominis]|uniref:Uncharacterized protein n=2 Tax=Aerococcus urinaehominis TaxID=128944 RepID=A0A109RGM6_9LACT|nr:hypothetical protein AWM75_05775 [Aerococcus urinaehominis]
MFLMASLVTQPVIAKGLVTNVDQTATTIPPSPVVSDSQGSAIVASAQTYLGVPYVWGGLAQQVLIALAWSNMYTDYMVSICRGQQLTNS